MSARLAIDRITIKRDRIVCEVRCLDMRYCYTNPAMAARALAARPHLAEHACVNEHGETFGAVIARTPLPHLLEHVAIDILTEIDPRDDQIHTGVTEWIAGQAGRARVHLALTDDLIVLSAVREALRFINEEVVR